MLSTMLDKMQLTSAFCDLTVFLVFIPPLVSRREEGQLKQSQTSGGMTFLKAISCEAGRFNLNSFFSVRSVENTKNVLH